MKILEVGRYKKEFAHNLLPFVLEQGESLRAAGCEVDYFPVRGNYFTAVRALKAKIRDFHPDIVHAHYGLSGVTAALAVLSLRLSLSSNAPALVITFHNGEWHNWHVNLLSSLFARLADHLIYVAPHIREKMYIKHPHYTILPCGVNMEESTPTDYRAARAQLGFNPDTYYILFGGAFSNTRKNVALLREAVQSIEYSHIRDKKDNSLNSLILEGNVLIIEMRGMDRKTVALYMSACDLFALPTKNEGSPQALKEAMACNCPIVATDCADIAHLLGIDLDLHTGTDPLCKNSMKGHYLLSNKGKSKAEWVGDDNSIEELRSKIEEAMQLPRGFRTKGRERIIELGYTNELVAEKLLEIYKGVRKEI